ncbi:MAG TPA: SPASM domain-containing protein [Ignavibacteriaceae bacterium]|nr:SPASM domain-containing protein [Ignavibacteriaceae bacterium]
MEKAPISYWTRYPFLFIKYGNFKKGINLIKAGFNYLLGIKKISSKPFMLKIEISNFCLIDCKLCFASRTKSFFPLDEYKKIINDFKNYSYLVSLYDIGEPLLNENAIDYIKYAHQNNMGTIISTSLSIDRPAEYWKDLALSGIDRIIVAIDGLNAKTYNKYRTNGNFELVMKNLNTLLKYRKEFKKKFVIEWQMIRLKWNKEQHKKAAEIAKELGCEFRSIVEAKIPRSKYKSIKKIREKNCMLPYFIYIINSEGNVRPCYKNYEDSMLMGNIYNQEFSDIWNSKDMQLIRSKKEIKHKAGCSTCLE